MAIVAIIASTIFVDFLHYPIFFFCIFFVVCFIKSEEETFSLLEGSRGGELRAASESYRERVSLAQDVFDGEMSRCRRRGGRNEHHLFRHGF